MRRGTIEPDVTRAAARETGMQCLAPTDRASASSALNTAAAAALLGLIGTLVAGCDTSRVADQFHPRLSEPARRHPIIVVAETATLDVPIPPPDPGGEARAYVETTRFMRNYRYEGRGPLNIAVPRHAGRSASQRIQAVRLAAYRAGIPPQRLRMVGKPGPPDTITLSYDRIAAVGPTCGDWSEDVTRNPKNLPYNNFGCASQRNLAAMAANPLDLMFPTLETPRGSETRASDTKNFQTGVGKPIPGVGSASK